MCQYSSILQAISNVHQYSEILPEQLADVFSGPAIATQPTDTKVDSEYQPKPKVKWSGLLSVPM